MRILMAAVLVSGVSGTGWGQSLEQAFSAGAVLSRTARAQGEILTARGSAPCTPEPGHAWCFAPSPAAAMGALSPSGRSLVKNGVRLQVFGLLTELAKLAGRTNDEFLKGELKAMGASYQGMSGEALFNALVPASSKPTVDFSGGEVSYSFNIDLTRKIGSRPTFFNEDTIRHLAREHSLFCSGNASLVLWTDKAGNPRAETPLQADDTGCVAD